MIIAIAAVWALLCLTTVALLNLAKLIVRHAHEIAGCPDPDICPGCDGYLEFDDDGSNICPMCGLTWWRR